MVSPPSETWAISLAYVVACIPPSVATSSGTLPWIDAFVAEASVDNDESLVALIEMLRHALGAWPTVRWGSIGRAQSPRPSIPCRTARRSAQPGPRDRATALPAHTARVQFQLDKHRTRCGDSPSTERPVTLRQTSYRKLSSCQRAEALAAPRCQPGQAILEPVGCLYSIVPPVPVPGAACLLRVSGSVADRSTRGPWMGLSGTHHR
jgi:hypothetical protein